MTKQIIRIQNYLQLYWFYYCKMPKIVINILDNGIRYERAWRATRKTVLRAVIVYLISSCHKKVQFSTCIIRMYIIVLWGGIRYAAFWDDIIACGSTTIVSVRNLHIVNRDRDLRESTIWSPVHLARFIYNKRIWYTLLYFHV